MGRHALSKNHYIGTTHYFLTLIGFEKCKYQYCTVRCICGTVKDIHFSTWRLKKQYSCGCIWTASVTKHNLSNTVEYYAWNAAKQRCINPNNPVYKDYGGRGIIMCKEWLNDPRQFLLDMGKRPAHGYSLERKNVNENYCKENCKWATPYEQTMNRRCMIT